MLKLYTRICIYISVLCVRVCVYIKKKKRNLIICRYLWVFFSSCRSSHILLPGEPVKSYIICTYIVGRDYIIIEVLCIGNIGGGDGCGGEDEEKKKKPKLV